MGDQLPPGLQYEEDDPAVLAAAFRAKPNLAAVVRHETARLVDIERESLPRWRWFKRWRLKRVFRVLEREEEAYRAEGSAGR